MLTGSGKDYKRTILHLCSFVVSYNFIGTDLDLDKTCTEEIISKALEQMFNLVSTQSPPDSLYPPLENGP